MSVEPQATAATPTAMGERLLSLDVLRGFALFGVFIVNASVSARPWAEAIGFPKDGPLSEQIAAGTVLVLFVSKFVAIFSLLFGMGLVLQCQRLAARGAPDRVYVRRLSWLAVFGVLHGCLLFEGDILLPYAVAGGFLYLLRAKSNRFLLVTAAVAFAIGLGLEVAGGMAELADAPANAELVRRSHDEGPLALLLEVRANEYLGWLIVSSLGLFNWQVVALFLVGAVLMRTEFLRPDRIALHRRTTLIGLTAGVVLQGLGGVVYVATDGSGTLGQAAMGGAFVVGGVLLVTGYVCGVLWWVQSGKLLGLQRGLAAVGRTALTSYLGQSVLMNVLFYWFGLGLFDRVTRLQVLGIVTVLFALQIVTSVLWLRRFAMGPAEWLWRRLTYGAEATTRRA